jgi:Fe-S-cluster containining protein
MGEPFFFHCEKCGTCCRNLLEEREGILQGLTLTAKEKVFFPKNMISPLTAIGKIEQKQIIDYQLSVNDCPHINEKNECQIYDSRPLICRAFPYVQGNFSMKCPILRGIFKKAGLRITFPVPDSEAEADQKRDRYFQNRLRKYMKKGSKIWIFNLATKQWVAILKDHRKSSSVFLKV